MNGFELILSAALCLSCTPDPVILPPGLILLDNEGDDVASDSVTPTSSDSSQERSGETMHADHVRLKAMRDYVNGRHFRIATLEDYPLSYTKLLENGTRIGEGVSFQLIRLLGKKFNFTYEVLTPPSNIIGSTNDFGGSLIEMLNKSDADMGAAFIPKLTDALDYIAYSTTTLDEGEWIMVMRRPSESASGSGLLAPFQVWVWIMILLSVLAVGPIIYVLIILRNKLTGDTEQKPYSLSHCAWFVYGALMKQGSTLAPIADSTRILFATWWIFITILTSFYTANLTAFLTLSKFTLPFNTVDDILHKQKHFVTQRGGGVEYAIRGTNSSLSKLYKMIKNNRAVFTDFVNDTQTLQTFVEHRGHVFVRDRPAINHVLYLDYRYRKTISKNDEKIHCPFAMARQPFLRMKRTFVYPTNSNLSLLFDPELLNLVEAGIVKHLSSRNLPNAEICPPDLGGTERQLRIGDLMMTYYIMFGGFATGFVVFTTEMLFRFLNQRFCSSNQGAPDDGVGRSSNKRSRWAHPVDSKATFTTYGSNLTPPPPYQSIYNSKKINSKFGNDDNSNLTRWQQTSFGRAFRGGREGDPFMPADRFGLNARYASNTSNLNGVRRIINGRDYIVCRTPNGQSQLVPMRVPSAALFQYTYTK